jgi:hypothetical protein
MSGNDRAAALRLLETGISVEFRVVDEQVLPTTDEAEFGLRVRLQFQGEEPDDAAEIVSWGAMGFLFALGALSFSDARPRGLSGQDFVDVDELTIGDFIECLSFTDGKLRFYADYIRGRRLKTDIVVSADGDVTLQTIGRGKAALRWLDRLVGKTSLAAV